MIKMNKKLIVSEYLETLGLYDLDGSVESAISKLQALMQYYPGKRLELQLTENEDGYKKFNVVWKREENEKELEKRLKQQEESKAYRRQQYEAMKKEFEGEAHE